MNCFAYYNGKYDKKEKIMIPLSDRSIFFGDAVYDAMIGSYDRILWENDHIDRLLLNAKFLGIVHPYTKSYLSSLFREIGVKSGLKSYFLYCQISRSQRMRNHSAIGCDANLLITIEPIKIANNNTPLKIMSCEDMRYNYCNIKTINLLPAVLALTEAEKRGLDEVVFLKDNVVTECAKSNIAMINYGRVTTHPNSNRILPGVTMAHLKKICIENNIPFIEKEFGLTDLKNADEILITSTTKLCRRVNDIDGASVGGKSPEIANLLFNLMYKEYKSTCLEP